MKSFNSSAIFGEDNDKYRYRLERHFDMFNTKATTFIMLNPSTADAQKNDPTIRRCMNFAAAWNTGRLIVVNLFGIRSYDPKVLKSDSDPIGSENNRYILEAAKAGHIVIAAWGMHGVISDRGATVRRMLADVGITLLCLGITSIGEPIHPLYVPKTTLPIPLPALEKPPAAKKEAIL